MYVLLKAFVSLFPWLIRQQISGKEKGAEEGKPLSLQ